MFIAAGKPYLTTAQLKAKQDGELDGILYRGFKIPVYRDTYGRQVLYFRERFPCFDEFDRMYEDRYYHWYIIRHDGGITLVYVEDGRAGAEVCENDPQNASSDIYVPSWLNEELKNAGLLPEGK